MNLLALGLFIYTVYLPIFLATVFTLVLNDRAYSPITFWISCLGTETAPHHRLFNWGISLFGLLGLFLVASLTSLFSPSPFSKISSLFLSLTCFATFLVGCLPGDRERKAHDFNASVVFTSLIGAAIFTLWPTYRTPSIPNGVMIINLLILTLFPVLTLSWYYHLTDKRATTRLEKLIIGKKGLWEWGVFCLAITWNLVMAISALIVLG